MSRSNPTDNSPNPSTRWFEWSGSDGHPKYYDKQKKETVNLTLPMTFILLDQTSTVKGWHEPSESGITSNEVRDTRSDVFNVRCFKGPKIAEGTWGEIRDRVTAAGGHFTAVLYLAYKAGDALAIGAFQFKGAALGAWFEFSKENRADLYKKAIRITGAKEGQKGSVKFKVPVFTLCDITAESEAQAIALDKVLQDYLTAYFKRTLKKADEYSQPDAPAVDPADYAAQEETARAAEEKARQAEPEQVAEEMDVPF